MNEQEKKRQGINGLLNAETKSQFFCQSYRKQRKIFTEKDLFKEKRKQKVKIRLFNCSRYGD